jgi:hypothetical protein
MSNRDNPGRIKAVVKVGEGVLSVRKRGISAYVVCRVLGWEWSGGYLRVWMDKLIHGRHECEFDDGERVWQVEGAWVSVLNLRCDESAGAKLMSSGAVAG